MDVVMVVEVQELFSCELCVVIGDDDIRNSKAMVNVGEEQDDLLGAYVGMGGASIHLENLSTAMSRCM
jgi:hypothetical protein